MSFPNVRTQIGQPGGPKPGHGRTVGSLVGRKRARMLRRAAATLEAINNGKKAEFQGDAVELFRSVYKDLDAPIELRLAAARFAAAYERPTMGSNGASHPGDQPELDPAERRQRIRVLAEKLGLVPPAPPEPVTIEAQAVVDLGRLERDRRFEQERADLLRRIGEAEQKRALSRAARDAGGFTLQIGPAPPADPYGRAWEAHQTAEEAPSTASREQKSQGDTFVQGQRN